MDVSGVRCLVTAFVTSSRLSKSTLLYQSGDEAPHSKEAPSFSVLDLAKLLDRDCARQVQLTC